MGPDLESQQLTSLITAGCQIIPSWIGWDSHPTWNNFPHPLQPYKLLLTSFICCGWRYGAPIMLLPPHLWDRDWKVSWNHWSLPSAKWYHHAVVDVPTWNGSHFHFKHTKGYWQPSYAVDEGLEPPSCYHHHSWQSRLESWLKSWITGGHQMIWYCHFLGSNLTWDGSHIHSNSKHIKVIVISLFGPDFEFQLKSWITAFWCSCHSCHCCCPCADAGQRQAWQTWWCSVAFKQYDEVERGEAQVWTWNFQNHG